MDYAEDAQPYRSVERETEEELFGRVDVDSVLGDSRQADPMHRSRLSAPMGWLADHLDDHSWRTTYGGHIEASWESTGPRRYSTLDRDALTALVLDPAWSNEGLFALLQGLRRLAENPGDYIIWDPASNLASRSRQHHAHHPLAFPWIGQPR